MGENPNAEGWVNPRLPLTTTATATAIADPSHFAVLCYSNPTEDGWVNPRRPLTAIRGRRGAVAGGVGSIPPSRFPDMRRQIPLCRPPVATTTRDRSHSPIISSDFKMNFGAGLAGRPEGDIKVAGDVEETPPEEETPPAENSVESECTFSGLTLPPHIIALNPELWAQAVAEASEWMEGEMKRMERGDQ